MPSKIRIKVGEVEIEYEGEEQFLKQELTGLLTAVAQLHNAVGAPHKKAPQAVTTQSDTATASNIKLTTSTIAHKLNVKTGPELLIAAAAHLTFSKQQPTFSRQQLHDEMKSANAHYNKNYSANLSKHFTSALKDNKLTERAKDSYALTADAIKDLEARLG